MSLAEYRSVGMSNGIPKVLAQLYKNKGSVSLTDIRTAIGEESVKNALKKINDDDPENIMAIKAILVLYRQKSTLTGDLKRYYDFILGDGSKTIVSLYEDIVNAEKDGQWKDFIDTVNGLMNKASPSAATLPAATLTPALTPASTSTSLLPAAAAPSLESVSLVSAASAVPSEGAATAASSLSSLTVDTTKTKSTVSLSLKARVPAKVSGSLNVGYKIHIKDGALNKEKHNELKEQYNASAKLLVVDIESCTEVIYPIAIDLAPESTNQDVLDYIVKVLTEATQKNLKCHTGSSLHVFTIRTWTDTPRVLYVNIAK